MRRFYLKQAQAGDFLDDVYVITNKQIASTATGKYYIKAFLGDKTSQVTARMWNATRETFAALPDSGFVHVRARVENYQNNLQVVIDQWSIPKDDQFDIADLMPTTRKDITQMYARLIELCGSIQNRHLAAIVDAFTEDETLMKDFRRSPAAMTFHHAYIGGLLEHTLNAMEVADAMVKFYPKLNRDLVVAGIFLHDLAKTWELKYETSFGYTDGGQLVGHIVKIAMWIEAKAEHAAGVLGEPVPRLLIDVLQHIVLSHHGEPEFGAAKVPATPEAIAVHIIENMDAKLTMALLATRDEETVAGWTDYLKAFNGRMFRPDVAPAEVVEEEAGPVVLTNPLFGEIAPRKG